MKQIVPTGGNADSINILSAASALSKRKEARKFLFILSDGMPSAYGSKFSAENEVKKAVDEVRKMGIEVVSIMFGDEQFRKNFWERYKMMYSRNIISCDAKNIVEKLPKTLAKIIVS